MKILVPSDFSKYADYALDAACLLSNKFDGQIHIMHSMQENEKLRNSAKKSKGGTSLLSDMQNEATAALLNRKIKLQELNIEVKTHLLGGHFINDIAKLLEIEHFDLIVMGSHGISGKQEWFIGSNTQKVVRKIRCNTLVVKNPLESIHFDRILFASNLYVEDQAVLRDFLTFIEKFNIKELHVMTVDTMGFFHSPKVVINKALQEFRDIASAFNVETHFYTDYSVEAGIRHFSEERSIDLVAVSNRKKHPIKRIFQGSNVEMLVNHLNQPVLCIDH